MSKLEKYVRQCIEDGDKMDYLRLHLLMDKDGEYIDFLSPEIRQDFIDQYIKTTDLYGVFEDLCYGRISPEIANNVPGIENADRNPCVEYEDATMTTVTINGHYIEALKGEALSGKETGIFEIKIDGNQFLEKDEIGWPYYLGTNDPLEDCTTINGIKDAVFDYIVSQKESYDGAKYGDYDTVYTMYCNGEFEIEDTLTQDAEIDKLKGINEKYTIINANGNITKIDRAEIESYADDLSGYVLSAFDEADAISYELLADSCPVVRVTEFYDTDEIYENGEHMTDLKIGEADFHLPGEMSSLIIQIADAKINNKEYEQLFDDYENETLKDMHSISSPVINCKDFEEEFEEDGFDPADD